MGYDKIMKDHYSDLNNLSHLLDSYVNSYRLLASASNDVNGNYMTKESYSKGAAKRTERIGRLIDEVLDVLEECEKSYIDYIRIKNGIIMEYSKKDIIKTEIDTDLDFFNKNSQSKTK